MTDPTDDALATIASILDHPAGSPEPEKPAWKAEDSAPAAPVEADGYSKLGPGPVATIRLRWTARRAENGDYYVDETIGENSIPIIHGPMSQDAAIRLVDERERDAHRKFEQLRSEMAGRAAAEAARNGTA